MLHIILSHLKIGSLWSYNGKSLNQQKSRTETDSAASMLGYNMINVEQVH